MRNGHIDILRFAGSIGIIYFHLNLPGAAYALSALQVFVILLVTFGDGRPSGDRVARLLGPWIIWSAVFALAKAAQAVTAHQPLGSEFHWWMLATGTSLHLWFLPFSFVFLAVVSHLRGPFMAVAAVTASGLALWASNTQDLPIPLTQWASVLPAAFLGLAMRRTGKPLPLCGLTAVVAAGCFAAGWYSVAIQTLMAVVLTTLALKLPLPSTAATAFASRVSYGMYLIHPLAYAVALRLPGLDQYGRFVVVVAASFAATLIVQRLEPRAVGERAPQGAPWQRLFGRRLTSYR